MYYVYILKSKKDNSLYKGYTSFLIKRLEEHNNGKSIYTSTKMPWILVYFEKFDTQKDAITREKYLKSAAGRRFLKNINLEREVDLNTV